MSETKTGLTLEETKLFLRIDGDDDNAFINLITEAARKYIEKQIGVLKEEDPRVKMLILGLVSNMYTKRMLTVEKDEKVQYVMNSMIMQLQFEFNNKEV